MLKDKLERRSVESKEHKKATHWRTGTTVLPCESNCSPCLLEAEQEITGLIYCSDEEEIPEVMGDASSDKGR